MDISSCHSRFTLLYDKTNHAVHYSFIPTLEYRNYLFLTIYCNGIEKPLSSDKVRLHHSLSFLPFSSPFQTGLGSSLPPPSLLSPHSKLHLSGALAEQLIPQAALSCQHRGSPKPRVSHLHSLMIAYNSRLCTTSL